MTTKRSLLFFFLLFAFVVLLPVVSADDGTTIDDEENGFFVVPVPPPIPSDFDGDVYEHPERTTEEKNNFVKAASGARGRRREDEDDGNDKIPLLTILLCITRNKRNNENEENAKSALENAKNGKTSELERNLETLGNYLEDMESVLSGGKGDGVVRKDDGNDDDIGDNGGGGGAYSSDLLSRKSSATGSKYHRGDNNEENAKKRLMRLASVQKFPHPITSVKFTRHRERDLKMEIYDNNKSERVDDETNTMRTKSRTMMKVMARVDDIVPKIALVGDEKGTLFALDVKSGEILCKYDLEKSGRNAITTIESYAVADDSSDDDSSKNKGSKKSKSGEKVVDTRIILGRADGSVTFLTMRLEEDGDESNGSTASLTHFGTITPKTMTETTSNEKKGSTSEALSQRREKENQGRDVAVVATHVAVLHNGERRVIVANGKSTVTIIKEAAKDNDDEKKVILGEDLTYTSEQMNTRGRIMSFQSVLLSKTKRKRLRQQKQYRVKTDIMAITSRGEIVILSLSLSSDLSSFEVVSCTTPGSHARTPFETVSDGAFEPTSSTNSARVVLDASQLAYLKVTEREDNDDDEKEERSTKGNHYSCSLSSARPLKFGLSLLSSSSSSSLADKEAEDLMTFKIVSLRDGVAVFSASLPSSSSPHPLFNGIRAYETNTDFKTRSDDDETYFAKDGVKFSWRDVLYDITKGEEEDGERLSDDTDDDDVNVARITATGDGRRTIAFALPSHPSVLVFYRWQGGMSELERNRALMRRQQRKNAQHSASSFTTVFDAFTRLLESKITPAILVGVVSYYTFFVKNKDAAVKLNERARIDYANMMHTAREQQQQQQQYQQNGRDSPQFKRRDSRKLYREFDPKKFRKEVLVPKEKMKMKMTSSKRKTEDENAPAGAPPARM
ncbi:unnamed protein product [Bathycoccus prasinos]